ncbi:RNA polymerase factor sigma-54 [Saccharophagus sp. K07]|jgi:RNA polymerase sigma-54 factor|uniref:RNA polymerase factor sigma-54 n=1 Tax=Saccharophagus sp. K07 TaxID=2283636 RepID=UPI0016520D6B|nr:RNA polymerase factor sigma-54 [Saccharophagus sp. K07]MBC6907294.1 RNA polymerase factor sigma-54 [Saccharophagus sp. K07]
MKQSLQLKLGQQLTMTPQLQQAIRLLQLSTLDLQTEIQEALETNPMLDVAEDESSADFTPEGGPELDFINGKDTSLKSEEITSTREESEESIPDGEWSHEIPTELAVDTSWDDVYQSAPTGTGLSRPENEDMDFESRRGASETLQDYLFWQLNLTPMSDLDRYVAEAILDAVGPSGMLVQSIEEIWQGLQQDQPELEMDEVMAVLHRLQQFDPPGVVSQNLSECLLLQLRQMPKTLPSYEVAINLVQHYLPLLGARDFKQLMRKLRVKESELQEAIRLIQSLNPRPGEQIGDDTTEYVVPDVFVKKENNRWVVQLNPDIAPKLRINPDYASLVRRADSSTDNAFLRDNLQEARWFIKSLQSRNETLLKVATCIVERQQAFLEHGPEAMKPMVLHDVAEMVEMHESTISRVTTQKYMHTPQGIFELKYFFSSHVSTESGGECSSTAIRAIIKKLIAAENPRKPLSDSKITALLEEQGIHVARRTIAKYRESLGIAPSNERKRLV